MAFTMVEVYFELEVIIVSVSPMHISEGNGGMLKQDSA
jgi:hypothetical protein